MPSHSFRAPCLLALLALIAAVLLGGPVALAADTESPLDDIVDRYGRWANGHKALAITDGPRTAWAFAVSHTTSDAAVREALELCQARAKEAAIDTACRVIAVDDQAVDGRVASRRLARDGSDQR